MGVMHFCFDLGVLEDLGSPNRKCGTRLFCGPHPVVVKRNNEHSPGAAVHSTTAAVCCVLCALAWPAVLCAVPCCLVAVLCAVWPDGRGCVLCAVLRSVARPRSMAPAAVCCVLWSGPAPVRCVLCAVVWPAVAPVDGPATVRTAARPRLLCAVVAGPGPGPGPLCCGLVAVVASPAAVCCGPGHPARPRFHGRGCVRRAVAPVQSAGAVCCAVLCAVCCVLWPGPLCALLCCAVFRSVQRRPRGCSPAHGPGPGPSPRLLLSH